MSPSFSQLTETVLDSITEPIVFLDREMRYVFANETALELLKKTRADLIGRNVWDVYPLPPVAHLREAIDRAVRTGQETHGIGPIPDGTWFDCHSYPSEHGLAIVFRDVTEHWRAEKALVDTENRIRTMADAVPVLIWRAPEGPFRTYFNRAWLTFTGRTAEQEHGNGWIDAIHPDDVDRCVEVAGNAVDRREPFLLEYRLRRHDGSFRWILDQGVPLYGEDGEFDGFIGSCVDIHERKHAEEQLSFLADASRSLGSSLEFHATLRHIADLMVPRLADWCAIDILGEDKRLERVAVAHVNPERARWVIEQGRNYPSDPDKPHAMARVALSGESVLVSHVTEEILRANAQSPEHLEALRYIGFRSLMCVPLKVHDTSLGAIMMVWAETNNHYSESDLRFAEEVAMRGATAIENARLYGEATTAAERLHAFNETLEERVRDRTRALSEAVRELEERNQQLQDFAYVASHDLQEPLRKISTFADLVEDEYGQVVDENGRMYLSRITDASQRMGNLISDLLTYSRVSSQVGPFEVVDLNHVVKTVLGDLEVVLNETEGRVHVAHLPKIEADATQMRQLFQNLIGNALKFRMPDRPPIVHVTAREELPQNGREAVPGRVSIEVSDNGIGFEAHHADRIFLPFKRLHSRGEYPGTGVGLAICKRIAERHGGTITTESTPGEGSTFRVLMPKVHADEP